MGSLSDWASLVEGLKSYQYSNNWVYYQIELHVLRTLFQINCWAYPDGHYETHTEFKSIESLLLLMYTL